MNHSVHHTSDLFTRTATFFWLGSRFDILKPNITIFIAALHLGLSLYTCWSFYTFKSHAIVGPFGPFFTDIVDLSVIFTGTTFNSWTTFLEHWLSIQLIFSIIRMCFYRWAIFLFTYWLISSCKGNSLPRSNLIYKILLTHLNCQQNIYILCKAHLAMSRLLL